MKANQPLMFSGAARMKSRQKLQQVRGGFQRPQHRPAVDGAERVQAEEERGHDPEVAAAAAHGPEEVGVLLRVGGDDAAVGQHHLDAEQVVDGQAVGAREVADAAAQGQPADAGAWR